ncbi:MAG: tRNA (5-methylaminomethyl-2-thiouridine)(34)-methyltransferase MnmD [Rikenellaceae bacterium]
MLFIKADTIQTSDGSNTLKHPIIGDTYHSINGALEESAHIYINCLLKMIPFSPINIFEMGFGSGLNALLTLDYAVKNNIKINYTTVELYPLDIETVTNLAFNNFVDKDIYDLFIKIHSSEWNVKLNICDNFSITKLNTDLLRAELPNSINLVYFDAFAPDTQPQLWSVEQFERLYNHMTTGSILTTYSSKGVVKQAFRKVGFTVQRLNGVGGKRHILRCTK